MVPLLASAQPPEGRSLLAEGQAAYGVFVMPDRPIGQSDWRAMLPGSVLLKRDMSGSSPGWYGMGAYGSPYGYDIARGNYGSGSAYLGVGLDLGRPGEVEPRFEKRLRLGLNLAGYEDLYNSWGRTLTGVYDTLVSQQTGQMTFLDSSWTESYSAYATRERITVDATFMLRRASRSRWSWFVGAGLMVGTTYSGNAEVSHTITRSRDGSGGYPSFYEYRTIERETFRLDATLFAAAYALLGIDFRLGRTSPFWSDLHLFCEARPMLHWNAYPGLPSRMDGSSQHLFGFRFDLR